MKHPHVVIIMADQLRYDAFGEHTPHLNQLRNESTVFEHAYCASPLCVPARGSFFTGKYPNITGALHNAKIKVEKQNGMVKSEHINLYDLMDHKWDSWHTGKMDFRTEQKIERNSKSKTNWLPLEPRYGQFLKEHHKKRPGGNEFRGVLPNLLHGKRTYTSYASTPKTGCYQEDFKYFYDGFILHDTLHAISNRDKRKPFLLNAMFFAPHPPLDIPEPWYSKIQKVNLPENVGVWGENQSPLQLYNLTGIMGANKSREDWREVWRVYQGFVSMLDDCVGQVVQALKTEGIYDQSLIIFTSDHGEMLGSHRLWQKMCMYEESIRTPLFMKFPKQDYIHRHLIKENVSSIDILPTLCDYLQIKPPDDCSGLSLMPLLQKQSIARENIFVQYDGNGSSSNFSRCIIQGDNKLIVDFFKDEVFIELYNKAADPQEMNNLAFEIAYKDVVESLLDDLRTHMVETKDSLTLNKSIYSEFVRDYKELT